MRDMFRRTRKKRKRFPSVRRICAVTRRKKKQRITSETGKSISSLRKKKQRFPSANTAMPSGNGVIPSDPSSTGAGLRPMVLNLWFTQLKKQAPRPDRFARGSAWRWAGSAGPKLAPACRPNPGRPTGYGVALSRLPRPYPVRCSSAGFDCQQAQRQRERRLLTLILSFDFEKNIQKKRCRASATPLPVGMWAKGGGVWATASSLSMPC